MMENPGISSDPGGSHLVGSELTNGSGILKMTSIDSGIETGNDSNDSAVTQSLNNLAKITAMSDGNILDKSFVVDANTWPSSQLQQNNRALEKWPIDQPGSSLSLDFNTWHSDGISKLSSFDNRQKNHFMEELKRMDRPLSPRFPLPDAHRTSKLKRLIKKTSCRIKLKPYENDLRTIFRESEEHKLRTAVITNNVDLVKSLLEHGVSPNGSDREGRTLLHIASGWGYMEIVDELLKHGADAQSRDCIGNTPLHLAAATNKISVVRLLLDAGTDPLSTDHHGYNPLQLAQTKLRMLQNSASGDMLRVKAEFQIVFNMLLACLKNRPCFDQQVEALSNVCSRLTVSNTNDQIQDEVRDLLSSINSLNLKS